MTPAKVIVSRLLAKKFPNRMAAGEQLYSFNADELEDLITAVQENAVAWKSWTEDRAMARECGVAAEILATKTNRWTRQTRDGVITLLRRVEKLLLDGR